MSLLLLLVTVAGLDPARARRLVVEVETAVSTDAAVGCTHAFKRWLGRPGKRTLFGSEVRQELDDFIRSK